ncbi:MAG: glycosyltransferase family 2 protein [Methylacidiphilales bacterium]|nr:glycosyltransferase family 2 protein [Candidatus Methylacidiphilales bacterium]
MREQTTGNIEVSVIMPCLNEAETLERCILKARKGIDSAKVTGEIIIADNGSTDGSQEIAVRLGVRVVQVEKKGYGNALRRGIEAACGQFVIMGDSDDSYDFSAIAPFVEKLKGGDDLVMGCRLPWGGGTIMPRAMPWKHRWIGNPVLSFIGRLFFRCPVTDFHCGLRAFRKTAYEEMDLQTTGMEFASEMVIKATLRNLRISEVPITLYRDGRSRPPHLRSWRDGWRHLRFMMLYSPRWLFLIPGLALMLVGLALGAWLLPGVGIFMGLNLDVHTLLYAAAAILVGFQSVVFAVFTKIFAISERLLPEDPRLDRMFRHINLERGLLTGVVVSLCGIGLSISAVFRWHAVDYGSLQPSEILRIVIPAVTLIVLGSQIIFASFFLSILGLRRT